MPEPSTEAESLAPMPSSSEGTAEEVRAASPPRAAAQVRLVSHAEMVAPRAERLEGGDLAIFSRRCATKETPNEDAAVVIPIATRGVILAIADGVGGLPQGEEAARIALRTLVESVLKAPDPSQLRMAIIDAIERANRRILSLGSGAGTTLAIAQIIEHRLRTYHVGDSEILVISGGGSIKMQTLAHGPVAYGVHCGLIDPEEALRHESRNLVSNIVGSKEMRIELGPPVKLAQRDLVLLCSDGITDNLYADQIASQVGGKSPSQAAAAILQTLEKRREQNSKNDFKEDDATFLLFRRTKESISRASREVLPSVPLAPSQPTP